MVSLPSQLAVSQTLSGLLYHLLTSCSSLNVLSCPIASSFFFFFADPLASNLKHQKLIFFGQNKTVTTAGQKRQL